MTPGARPAADLISFIREAGRLNRYNRSQQRLYSTAVALVISHSPDSRSLTVNGIEQRLAESNPFSAKPLADQSIASYRSRVRRALRDFYKWGDNFAAWDAADLSTPHESRSPPPQLQLPAMHEMTSMQFKLPSGRVVELRHPTDPSGEDAHAIAALLRSLADLFGTQAAVREGKDP